MASKPAISAILLLALRAGTLGAQAPDSIRAGDRIRLDLQSGERIVGGVSAYQADTIWLVLGQPVSEGPYAILTSRVHRYSISRGKDRGRGAKIGALVGGVVGGALVGFAIRWDQTAEEVFVPATVVAVPVGVIITGLGVVIGAIAAPPRWTNPVTLNPPAKNP